MFHRFYCTLFLVCGVVCSAIAQICQGSLGDPIINTTFGSGANPGPSLSAAATNYTYVTTDCPGDGKYAVRNRTENCFDTTWFSVTDHTGDPNGYFMLVNASYDPGDFYIDTVRGLCQGSTYEFAAWIINVKRPVLCWGASQIINPDITFRIEKTDGTLLQSYNTNSIPASTPPQWKQYGFFFTTPAGVSDVIVRMVNNAPGGCGNDLGLDDITFRPCGPQVNSSIVGSSSTSDTLCSGTARTYTFNAQASPGYNNPSYQWQKNVTGTWTDIPGATSTTYTVDFPSGTTPGTYSFRIVTAEAGNISSTKCRVSSQTVNVLVTAKPDLAVSANGPVCEGADIILTANTTASIVNWNGPNGFAATGKSVSIPEAKSMHSGKYFATVNKDNCNAMDSTTVTVVTKPVIQLNTDSATICEGDKVQLSVTGASNYKWEPATGISDPTATSVFASPVSSVMYSVIGSNANGCSDTVTAAIKVIKKPVANAGPDRTLLKGASIQLTATAGGDSINYFWTPDYAITGIQSLTPTVSPSTDTAYAFHVVSTAGCGSAVDTVRVTIYKEMVIPNAFSPNYDGVNDRWNVTGISSYPKAEISLFDRYGREIMRRQNFQGWDGTKGGVPVPSALYYYVIDLKNETPKITGWVFVTR